MHRVAKPEVGAGLQCHNEQSFIRNDCIPKIKRRAEQFQSSFSQHGTRFKSQVNETCFSLLASVVELAANVHRLGRRPDDARDGHRRSCEDSTRSIRRMELPPLMQQNRRQQLVARPTTWPARWGQGKESAERFRILLQLYV